MRTCWTAALVILPLALGACGSGSGDFCGALSDATTRCAAMSCSSPCDQTLVTDCSKVVTALNPAFLQAVTTCLASTCTPAGTGSSIASCLATSISGVTPTDAQKTLASHFCAKCAGGAGSACTDAFFSTSSSTSVGALLAPVSDSVVRAVDNNCISPILCTPPTFAACATPAILSELGKSVPTASAMCLVNAFSSGSSSGCNSGGADLSGAGSPDLAMSMSMQDLSAPSDLSPPACSSFDSTCTMFGASCTGGRCTNVSCCCPAARICGSGSFPYCCAAGKTCRSSSSGPVCL